MALTCATLSSPLVAAELELTPSLKISDGAASIEAPADGLWTIGTGWENDVAKLEHHAKATQVTQFGEWHILSGQVETPEGSWRVEDQYRSLDAGLVQGRRRWTYDGAKPSGPVVLSIRFQVDALSSEPLRPFLPGINYFGNPSGTRIASERVPTWTGDAGCEGLYEEHRFPLPFASVESDRSFVAALHSRPSVLPFAARDDLWWSLGLVQNESGVELRLQSGPVASNGTAGVVKARQRKFLPYPDAHLVGVPPGTVIEKEFYLQLESHETVGHGFHAPLWTSIDLFDPKHDGSMPSTTDVLAAKLRDTFDRWHEDEHCVGFRTRPPQAQPWFMMGWADRAEVPGFALQAMNMEKVTEDPQRWRRRAIASIDFLIQSPSQPKLQDADFSIVYDYEQHQWLRRQNILSQSQALNALADAIAVAMKGDTEQRAASERWKRFLKSKVAHIASDVLSDDWRPVSTNQAFAIAPLVKASDLFADEQLMTAARKIADHSIERHQEMREPYWGGTLDAKCEDKEGAWAAMQGYCALYDATREAKYLQAAVHAGDVVLSYLYVWDVPMPPGRLADHAFKTRGWTSVSVQNQHLDVFGVLFTPELWQLAQWTGDKRYQQLAKLMFVSAGQMTNLASGVQGEQMFQTNYQQHDATDIVEGMRGGYSEAWNIYWISAHFLTAAAKLEQLGVQWSQF
ncbi:MAG: hypothetical protein AAGD07_23370 [Planctomycetota bacterium]